MTAKTTYDFNKVFKENAAKVKNLASKEVKDKDRVADIVQEVFSVFYENLIANNPIQNISSWLMGVTKNKIRETRRKDAKFIGAEIDYGSSADDDQGPVYLHEILPDATRLPDAGLFNEFIKAKLEEAIEELPKEQKWVFIQHEIEERSFKEMEAETGVPLRTLLSRKHYAILSLQKKLKQVYEDYKIK